MTWVDRANSTHTASVKGFRPDGKLITEDLGPGRHSYPELGMLWAEWGIPTQNWECCGRNGAFLPRTGNAAG